MFIPFNFQGVQDDLRTAQSYPLYNEFTCLLFKCSNGLSTFSSQNYQEETASCQ